MNKRVSILLAIILILTVLGGLQSHSVGIEIEVVEIESTQYDFSYSYNDPSSSQADDYIVSTENAVLYSEGNVRYWKQDIGSVNLNTSKPGEIIYHFDFDHLVAEADLSIRTSTFHWSYSKGHSFIYASKDGISWTRLIEAEPPEYGSANTQVLKEIPESLLGARSLWFKVELNSYGGSAERGGAMTNTAQHSRYDTTVDNETFRLNVNFSDDSVDPVDPEDPSDPGDEPPSFTVPGYINISVDYTNDELIISWPEITGAVNYILAIGFQPDDLILQLDLGNVTSFRFPLDHLGGHSFYVAILAVAGKDEVQVGDVVAVKSPNAFDVSPSLQLESDSETIWLKWNAVEEAEAYVVEIGTEPGMYEYSQEFQREELGEPPVVNISVENLPTGPICFVVSALRGDEKGPQSNVVHFARYPGEANQTTILADGSEIATTGTATGETVDVFFYPIEKPAHIGEEVVASYALFSTKELAETRITIPVNSVSSADDIDVLHMQGEIGPADPVPFEFDPQRNTVTVDLSNNWTFINIPDPLKGNQRGSSQNVADNSANLILIASKNSASNATVVHEVNNIIEMPFFEQSSGTCWAAGAMMLRKGGYPAWDGPISDRRIYQWMANMGIGINEGLNILRYDSYVALIGNEVTFNRYFFHDSVKEKIIELINQGLPVIFTRSAHIVLVVGYRHDENGDLILIQNNSQGKMYEEESYEDAVKENDWRQFLMLTWSKVAPHPERALQTVGIPTFQNSGFGQLYFSGSTEEGNTGKAFLEFNELEEGGYTWTEIGRGVDDNFITDFATELHYEIPVYNTDRTHDREITLLVELSEDSSSSQEANYIYEIHNAVISAAETVTLGTGSAASDQLNPLNLTPLKNSVDESTPFTLSIALLDKSTQETTTEVLLEKINIGPFKEEDPGEEPANTIISTFEGFAVESSDRWGIGSMAPGFADGWFQSEDVADYRTDGGNPDGHITWRGDQRDWWYFTTYSSKYRGDRSFAVGKSLSFDLKTDNSNPPDYGIFLPFVVISGEDSSGNPLHIYQPQAKFGNAHFEEPGGAWTSYSIRLDSSAGWIVSDKSSLTGGEAAADSDIRQVLTTLSSLRIRGEYGSHAERGYLDNVVLGGNE